MRKLCQGFTFGLAALLLATTSSPAIEGLKLQIVCPDVVLTWPSVEGQNYVVQYRPTLDPITPWQTLTNSLAAIPGTNQTFFVHSNRVDCPTGQSFGMILSSGGVGSMAMSTVMALSAEQRSQIKQAREAQRLAELLIRCEVEQREPYEWELKNEPPLPPPLEEIRAKILQTKEATQSGEAAIQLANNAANVTGSLLSSFNNCTPVGSNFNSGFYRVFCPAPMATLDVFGVEQDSSLNQLDILHNDLDPDDNPFLLSYVQPAVHGEIEFSDDATVFRYTPTNAFAGLETFSYSITNDVGGSNTATVFVFVNAVGNGHPSTLPLKLTIQTNQTVIAFPILTNATDPDSDPLQLVVIAQPSRGMVATNSNNEIVYSRTTHYIAQDSFSYVLTDGHGGFVKQTVIINPQDDDGDGIPDLWELQHELSPTDNDADNDPDEDGLPHLAEYKLDTCPWTSDSPLNLSHIATNQPFRNFALIPVPLKSHINKPALSMLLNGSRANGSLAKRADGNWYFNWDTGYLDNGTYSLALELGYRVVSQPGDVPVIGATVPITITNDVTFSQLASTFSDFIVFDVKLAEQTANWRIELFDEQNQYLGSFSGMTTDGAIQGSWGLTDNLGNQLAFSHVRTDFYISPTNQIAASGNSPGTKRWFIKQTPGGIGNTFVVAWGWDAYTTSFFNNRTTLMLNGVINILANPARDDEYFLRPGANLFDATTFRYDDDSDKETLLAALKANDSGNFFWFGHGAVDVIQGNYKHSSIPPDVIENTLQNKRHRSTERLPTVDKHPYRLVILNGCKTYGVDWANAFGIDFQAGGATNDVVDYYQHGRQSQALVGWTQDIQVPGLGSPNYWSDEYAEGLATLFSRWMDGYALESCLTPYAVLMGVHGFSGHDSWRVSGTSFMWRTAP